MKSNRIFVLVATSICVLLTAPSVEADDALPDAAASEVAIAQADSSPQPLIEQAIQDRGLRKMNVDPTSSKAQIINKWSAKIQQAAAQPDRSGNAQAGQGATNDPTIPLSQRGLARISPEDRLAYMRLVVSLFDRFAPADCYGMTNMGQIISRVMSVDKMSDAETNEYFSLIYKIVLANARQAAIDIPSESEHDAAVAKMDRMLNTAIANNKADADRIAGVMVDPSHTSATDRCWLFGLTLHAMLSLDNHDRDVLYRYALAAPAAQNHTANQSPALTLAPATQ